MKDFYSISSEEGQTIYDVALQEYGDYGAVFMLMEDNPVIADLNHDLAANTKLFIRNNPDVDDVELMRYIRDKKININSRADG